ncbi:UDP-N-acetylmuramate--L-alanine ligase [Sediminibacterium sp.]|jgi:UDP-N-acetylmuramate: L-alanyl-gamma-D-glutamyl-meso-diaminopimelate ligase|uniref:UDP-N-acetylmuramate--L-alanine ligase n=1 Tax=Sediminibacterium sp. TaxID=1917865 RepID=UPI00271ADC1D|nr:Mur ligase family protein [Sediminibacterium sp.]MDO8996252.1 Mur ligase family protein [Sediminibacterium sp.]MDP2420969.1 Mur ligase family protein [Sediminibacterium sp.]
MKVHFISIGGSVMHQLAIALSKKGYRVTGTDDEIFEPAWGNLKEAGILPAQIGWDETKIQPDLDAVILGMHARADNPELLKAKALGLNIYSFPEYIYKESLHKKRVVVGGSHGKTTTTSMIMHVLKKQNRAFDYLVGAKLSGFEQSVNITDAPIIVCEGDEYPASAIEKKPKFHFLYPHIAILTGIAWDHINVFPTFDFYLEQFIIFINRIEKGGMLIYNESDKVLANLVANNIRDDIQYQPYQVPPFTIENGLTTINIGDNKGPLSVFGNHNLMNCLAAYYACAELGVTAIDFLDAMKDFTGAAKRLELLEMNDTMSIYRDFAHAPSKVKATVQAVKQQFPKRKLYGILELHTYSSLNVNFMNEYKGALDDLDASVVFYAKHALEIKKMPELPVQKVMEGFDKPGLIVMNDKNELEKWLLTIPNHDANILFMSSGNYDGLNINSLAKAIIHHHPEGSQ